MASKAAALGGNSLGLGSLKDSLALILVTVSWANAADDALVQQTVQKLVGDIDAVAVAGVAFHPFKYLNYADKGQDVFGGYGTTSKVRLQAVSLKYDPHGVFQTRGTWRFQIGLASIDRVGRGLECVLC